jgi:diguanylate cyclase (GGDEF)-like protein
MPLDELTGLPTFDVFKQRLAAAVRGEAEGFRRFSVMAVDIHGLREVNKRVGRPEADAVLAEIAARLASAVRATDVVCRMTEDRFVFLLRDTGDDEVEAVYDRLDSMLLLVPTLTGIPVGIAAGAAQFHGEPAEALVERATGALERAKALSTRRLIIAVDG